MNLIDYQNDRFVTDPISKEEALSMQGITFSENQLLLIGTISAGYNINGWTSYLLSLIL